MLVEAVAVGVCGTDVEIAEGKYGWAPPGQTRLVLGHESLGRVLDPGPTSGLKKGDLVVGIVRRPDPVPCPNCAVGEWDMCRNGQYTERGIKQIHGFMSERWRIEPEYAIKVDPPWGSSACCWSPTTVVAKAWEHVLAVGRRAFWEPKTVLVTGAGPIGLLGALLGQAARLGGPRPGPTRPAPSPNSCAPWARPIILAASRRSGLSRTSSWSARGSGQVIAESSQAIGGERRRVPDGRRAWRHRAARSPPRTSRRRRC